MPQSPIQSQFLLAAPSSGSGKTTVAMGLMYLLTQQQKKVQAFKCGPDYIDPLFHKIATNRPSINVDTFMASEQHIRELHSQYASKAEVCIFEGMMGMFDGYDRSKGSSAEIARLLNIPVILIIDAGSTAYSVAPLIRGFVNFDPKVNTIGVIFNRVGSEKHANMLKEACKDIGVECFGCISRNNDLKLESRYLGLDISPIENKSIIETWANFIKEQINVELLLNKTRCSTAHYIPQPTPTKNLRIAVAKSHESFAFLYQKTLDRFNELGEIIFFNPETDQQLPTGTDILYLPGGYPEKRIAELNHNTPLMKEIRDYIESGGNALAECGGMIYLSQGIYTENGLEPMVGILPFSISNRKESRKLSLGYRQFDYNGQHLCGHEFHYTQIYGETGSLTSIANLYNAKREPVNTPVFRYKNAIASYTHLYLGESDLLKLWEIVY